MAVFRLRDSTAPLRFLGGRPAERFLKEEEFGMGVVSPMLPFRTTKWGDPWEWFAADLKAMCEQTVNKLGKYFGSLREVLRYKVVGRDKFRVVVCSAAPLNREKEKNAGQPEAKLVPMRIKLMSDIGMSEDVRDRELNEQGFLTQLAGICGPNNISLRIAGLNAVNDSNSSEDLTAQLSWNEADLCWETANPVQMNFKTAELLTFGLQSGRCDINVGSIEFELSFAGVCKVLQQQYGKHGDKWQMQQQILESGELSDMQIICGSDKDQPNSKPINCHRLQLAGASPVFARMLADGQEQKWKEAETRTVQLPESEQAILCMLHFLYYGGCEKILQSPVNVVLELLEAGVKYEMERLIDIATFALTADIQEGDWFTLDAAVKLYQFAALFEDRGWYKLKTRAYQKFRGRTEEDRNACAGYQQFRKLAVKLGPVFEYLLEQDYDSGVTWRPTSLPIVDKSGVTLEEAGFMYEFLSFGRDFEKPRNLDVGIGIMILAEFCGAATPKFANHLAIRFLFSRNLNHGYEADYLVDLFCQGSNRQGIICWQELKIGAMRCLWQTMETEPTRVTSCQKYKDMCDTPAAFAEFMRLSTIDKTEMPVFGDL